MAPDQPNVAALVVGAGRGRRLGGPLPKQYLDLGGVPVVRRTLESFTAHPLITAVRPVIHPDDRDLFDAAAAGLDVLAPVPGGASRQDSVRLGLESLQEAGLAPDLVLIHDAARPFVAPDLIDRVIDALAGHSGALPALAVTDTLKSVDGDRVTGTVDRSKLWRAQTPQGFQYDEILAAHRQAQGQELTDDVAVAEQAGLEVVIVFGDGANVKITTEDDLKRAQRDVDAAGIDNERANDGKGRAPMETRIGSGFDVHRFEAGDHVTLCGVDIPHDKKLAGHSDADVALHAITDAILGAIGAGDIGQHFPPSDAQWKGAASDKFLRHACDLARDRGGKIVNLDVTIICERPKLGPHRDAMQASLAAIAGIEVGRVSVKATTTEQLGFTGRGEGIAAQAVAAVALPFSD